jgi:hypothetical protein
MPSLAEVTPVDAAFFVKAGADPSQAAELAAQHNALSRRGGLQALESLPQVDNLPPPIPAPVKAEPMTPAKAIDMLQEHRNNLLTDHFAETFAPPSSPHEYKIPTASDNPSDAEMAQDNAIKSELHKVAVPRFIAESIMQDAFSNIRSLQRETDAQFAKRMEGNVAKLKGWYGQDYDSNMATLKNYLGSLKSTAPNVFAAFQRIDGYLTPTNIDQLVQLARFKAGKR